MTPEERQILLERLAIALQRGVITVELVNRFPEQPSRRIEKKDMTLPAITGRVRNYQATDGVWLYWWCWRQRISSIHDLERVVDRFCDVMLTVEGRI
jgi:hypothetical protein